MLVNDASKMTSLLTLHQPFVRGVLIKRYKRFLCDIQLESKEIVTAHCPNPGRMTSCYEPGWDVRCSFFTNTKRKLIYGLDLIYNGDVWIGVNTQLANRIVYNAIKTNNIHVFKAREGFIKHKIFLEMIEKINQSIHDRDEKKLLKVIKSCLPEFNHHQ